MGTPPRRDGQGGHEVDGFDLFADGFDPRMSTAEHEAYETDDSIVDPLARHYANLVETCEAMVFVYPTCWGGIRARSTWRALHDIESSSEFDRGEFLERVRSRLEAL